MARVHSIHKNKKADDVDYKGHHIEIKYRQETNDFTYHFAHTKTLTFDGHGSNYDNCLTKAKRYVDMVSGE